LTRAGTSMRRATHEETVPYPELEMSIGIS
jgi:hypothetical protein